MWYFLELDSLTLVLLTTFLFLITWKFSQKDDKAFLLRKLPGPTAFPIFGNIFEVLQSKEKILKDALKRQKKFGPVYKMWIGSHPVVILSRAEEIEIILKSSKHSEKSFGYQFLNEWLGTGLLTSNGHKWMKHRKLITPTFHFSVLQNFIEIFERNARILVGQLEIEAKNKKEFNIYPLVTLCALDIICETAMGTKINAQLQSQSQYVRSVYRLSTLTSDRITRIWLHPNFLFYLTNLGREYKKHLDIVQGFTRQIIKERKSALANSKKSEENKKPAFLDLLLQECEKDSANNLTDTEIREEVDTFMFEGHDTTAAAMNWALLLLGHHPQIQENVYQEVKSVFNEKKGESLILSDLTKMKLLERVIKETLRIFPSVSAIARCVEEDVLLGKYMVPKETNTFISIYCLHRDPRYFPDPEKFDPDRFLPENILKRHPFAYLPFSAGPRNCIGQKFALMEEKIVLSTLIYNFKFQSVEKIEEILRIPELILRPKFGIKMIISKR